MPKGIKNLVQYLDIKNVDAKTFFAVSDIHGSLDALIRSEQKSGFDMFDDNHILIVAGDIIEGADNQEDALIEHLRMLDGKGRLLAVLGNHDYRYMNGRLDKKSLYVNYRDSSDPMTINNDNWAWLKGLPIAIRTPYFNIVHGMWSDNAVYNMTKKDIKSLLNCTPCLIGTEEAKQWPESFLYETLDEYISELKKPTFIGHFYKCLFEKPLSVFQDENGKRIWTEVSGGMERELGKGAYINGNLICLDNHSILTMDLDPFVFTVVRGKVVEVAIHVDTK